MEIEEQMFEIKAKSKDKKSQNYQIVIKKLTDCIEEGSFDEKGFLSGYG